MPTIENLNQLTDAVDQLTQALQETIEESIKKTKPRPNAKRWWNGELTKMKKEINRLRSASFSFRALTDHPSHKELKEKSNIYGEAIILAKHQH